jgi:uncharacterized protein
MEAMEPNAEIVAALREAAPAAFDGQPVLFAYLFGSHATGRAHERSDIDVAIFLDSTVAPDGYFEEKLRLPDRLGHASRMGNVEVLILNGAPLRLAGNVLRDRVVIYSRDEPARVRYESRTLDDFLDFDVHARRLDQELLRAIAEGRR